MSPALADKFLTEPPGRHLASFLSRLFAHVEAYMPNRSSGLFQWEKFFSPDSPSKSPGASDQLPAWDHMPISERVTGCRQERDADTASTLARGGLYSPLWSRSGQPHPDRMGRE